MPDQTRHRNEAVLMAMMAIVASLVIATANASWQTLVPLFVAWDVAVIYVVSAVPLAFVLTQQMRRSVAAMGTLLLCSGCLAFLAMGTINAGDKVSSTFIANLLRTLVGGSIVLSIGLLARSVFHWKRSASSANATAPLQSGCDAGGVNMAAPIEQPNSLSETGRTVPPDSRSKNSDSPALASHHLIASLSFGVLVLALLPTVYIAARCQHEITELTNLLEQSRIGEARQLCQVLTALSPSADIRGRSLQRLTRDIDRDLGALTSRLDAIGPDALLPERRLERCRLLAMLGRNDEALVELIPLRQSPVSPAAYELSGTIHETTADWTMARDFHLQAKAGWIRQQESSERTAGVFRAMTRIAYCHRKLGDYELAEDAYREALILSPTAETHFLLAQFYEDMQQSHKAMHHTRQAMKLSPQRYQYPGSTLIDRLTVGHFGCLTIHFAGLSASQQQLGLLSPELER